MSRTIAAVAAASAAALMLGLTGPAVAAGIGVTDPRDTFHGSDLRAVQVRHLDNSVVIVTHHTNLRRDPGSGSSGAVFIDTDRRDSGPEFVFVGGYFEGTDYQLLRTRGFAHRTWGAPVAGSYRLRIDYDRDRVRMWMSRATLDDPARVRVAVRVAGTRTDGTSAGLVDWLSEPRSFTTWVAAG